jgi:hypothetical protein
MRPGITIWTVLGLAGSGLTMTASAQARPRQPVHLVGRVFDETRRTVDGVEIIVNEREVRARTNSAGIFYFDASPGDSTVGFRRIGYRPMVLTIDPLPPLGDTILVKLMTSPVSLPGVIVSAPPSKPLRYAGTTKYDDVFLRRRIGLGSLITREEIDNRFGVASYELLQGTPGVRVWNGPPKRIRFARCQEPGGLAIFIDGFRQIPVSSSEIPTAGVFGIPRRSGSSSREDEPEIEILSRIDPRDIEMIEVFSGPSEIPGVYHWNGCAVVAIWTRWNK